MKYCRACKNCQRLHTFCDVREKNSENLYKDVYYLKFINKDFNVHPCTNCKTRGIYCELNLRKKSKRKAISKEKIQSLKRKSKINKTYPNVPLAPPPKMIQTPRYNCNLKCYTKDEDRYLYPETKEVLLTNVDTKEMLRSLNECDWNNY